MINPGEGRKREIKGKETGQAENKYEDVNIGPILLLNCQWMAHSHSMTKSVSLDLKDALTRCSLNVLKIKRSNK